MNVSESFPLKDIDENATAAQPSSTITVTQANSHVMSNDSSSPFNGVTPPPLSSVPRQELSRHQLGRNRSGGPRRFWPWVLTDMQVDLR